MRKSKDEDDTADNDGDEAMAAKPKGQETKERKCSKADALYSLRPFKSSGFEAGESCGHCANFVAPAECVEVEGAINPRAWCTYYAPGVTQQGVAKR